MKKLQRGITFLNQIKLSSMGLMGLIFAGLLFAAPAIYADSYYWDINGTAAGAGGVSPNGIWDGSDPAATNWNTSSSGGSGGTITNLTTSDYVRFSAGTDATGPFTVSVVNTQKPTALYFDYGSVILSGGVVSNSWIDLGTTAGKVALLSVTDGCQLQGWGDSLYVGKAAGANSNGVYVGSTTGTNSILRAAPSHVQIGCSVNTGNWVKVDQGGLLTAQQYILIGSANNSVGNSLIITNGGQCSGSSVHIGLYTGGNSNWVYVGSTTGTNSILSAAPNDVYIGSGASTGNRVTVDRGGLLTAGRFFNIGDAVNSVGNSLIIKNGGQIIAGSQSVNIGNYATANGNGVTVVDGGIMTNMPGINVGTSGNGNYLVVTNGGQVSTKTMLNLGNNASANSNWVYVGSTTGTNSLLSLSENDLYIGCAANTSNWVMVDQGGVMNVNRYLLVGYGANAVGNYMVITNGGLVVSRDDSYVGGWNSGTSSNFVVIASSTASNSVWNLVDNPLYIGYAASQNGNYMNVYGGGMATNISTLTVGGNATASGNYFNLSGGGLLEINTGITMGTGPGSNNTLTNQGGILQFIKYNPTIATNSGGNVIVINGGTLGYRGVQSGNLPALNDNQGSSGVGRFLWNGNNTFRLDNCYATNSQASGYTVSTGTANNYAKLEMINGTTKVKGANPLTIASTGSLLVSNTTATIDCVFTNSGTLTLTNSTLALLGGGKFGEGSTINWQNTNAVINAAVGTLTLPTQLTVNVSGVSGKWTTGATLMTGISGTPNLNGWTINGARSDTRAVVRNGSVMLVTPTGMVFEIY